MNILIAIKHSLNVIKITFFILIIVSNFSCANLRQLSVSKIEQKDTTIIHIRDSVILRDSVVFVTLPKEVSKEIVKQSDTSVLETSVAKSVAYIKEGKLLHTLENKRDSIAKIVPIPVKFHIELNQEKQKEMIVQTIEVEKQLTKWQRFLINLGYITIGVIICVILFLFFRYRII